MLKKKTIMILDLTKNKYYDYGLPMNIVDNVE